MLLQLFNIDKTFFNEKGETKVLDDISFNIEENEIVSLLGPSGCGKSTLFNLINNIILPTKGKIIKNAKLGYMFQKDNLMPWRSLYKNIIFGLEVTKDKSKESRLYALDLMKKYHLEEFSSYSINELSGGMKQRASLIRTLVLKPDLLLLDEPFSSLDAQTRINVQNDVYKIIKEEKKSALIITHDISEAIALSDKIIILSDRPAKIKEIISLSINNLSPNERRSHKDFASYYHHIGRLLGII